MGCDIHFYVERKIDGVWVQQFDPTIEDPTNHPARWSKYWFHNRNYMLFGLLAGVRNDEITPLADPRGVPSDMSSSLSSEWNDWSGDGHTPSYFTLPELLEARDKNSTFTGFVNIKNYRIYKQTGQPTNVLSDINEVKWEFRNQSHEIVPEAEMERYVKMKAFLGETEYITEIIWERPNRTISSFFWEETLNKIIELDPDPNNIRCVFWFDN